MILKGKGSKRGRGTPANRLPQSLEISRTQLDVTLSNMLQLWSWIYLWSWPSLDQRLPETPSNLNYSVIHGSKSKAWWCLWALLYFSIVQVRCLAWSVLWKGEARLGFAIKPPAMQRPRWHPFSPAFANKMFSDYFQPCETQSCRQFVTSIAFTVVVRFAEV